MKTSEDAFVTPASELVGPPETSGPKPDRTWLGIGLCALSGVSYGAQALLVKWAYAQGVNTTSVLTLRFVVAAVGCWLLVGLMRPGLRLSVPRVAGLGFLGLLFVINSLFYYLSLDMLDAGTAALLGSTFPGWVVLWSVLFLKERLDIRRGLALLFALVGCVLTADPASFLGASGEKFSWPGVVLALTGALGYSFYILLSGRFGQGVPGLVVAAYSVPVTALVFIVWCAISGQFQWGMNGLGWLCCLGVGVGAAIAIGTYQVGIQLIGPSRAAITATTEPATAVLLGIVVLGETASLVKLLGGGLIIGAVMLLSRSSQVRTARATEEI